MKSAFTTSKGVRMRIKGFVASVAVAMFGIAAGLSGGLTTQRGDASTAEPIAHAQPADAASASTALRITGAIPKSSRVGGGERIMLTGSGFAHSSDGKKRDTFYVYFEGVPGWGVEVQNDSTLSVIAPPLPNVLPGTPIMLAILDYQSGAHFELDRAFTYGRPMQITSLSSDEAGTPWNPSDAGPSAAGAVITIKGRGFLGTTRATFGGYDARAFHVVDDSTLTVVTPTNHPVGHSVLEVTNPSADGPASTGFTFYDLSRNLIVTGMMEPGQSGEVPDFTCPVGHKYLVNEFYPRVLTSIPPVGVPEPLGGVQIVQSAGDSVSFMALRALFADDRHSPVIGFAGSLVALMNWGGKTHVNLYAYCTADKTHAAHLPY